MDIRALGQTIRELHEDKDYWGLHDLQGAYISDMALIENEIKLGEVEDIVGAERRLQSVKRIIIALGDVLRDMEEDAGRIPAPHF